jgi:hypothetical protein
MGLLRSLGACEHSAPALVAHTAHVCGVGAVWDGPTATSVKATKEEMTQYHKDMYIIRRMEITCDTEYKVMCVRSRL